MKKFGILTLFVICLSVAKLSAVENQTAGARAISLSDAFVTFYDSWSSFHNQAGLAKQESINAGMFFESRFMIDELSLAAGNVILPTNSGVFAINFSQFGSGTYKETKFGVAFSKQLSEKLSVGIQLDYLMRLMPENEKAKGFPTFEGGVIYQALENFSVGAHVFNPIQGGIEGLNGKIKSPVIVRTGGNYSITESVLVCTEIEKSTGNKPIYKAGIEFLPVEDMAIRFGVSTKPFAYTAGIGYRFGKLTTDIGFHYHGNLGLTPAISLQFHL